VYYFFRVKSHAVNVLECKRETAFVACAIIITAIVFLEFWTCFVDGVVG